MKDIMQWGLLSLWKTAYGGAPYESNRVLMQKLCNKKDKMFTLKRCLSQYGLLLVLDFGGRR